MRSGKGWLARRDLCIVLISRDDYLETEVCEGVREMGLGYAVILKTVDFADVKQNIL